MIKSDDENVEKSIVVWLNSTFAIMYLKSLFTTVEEEFGHIYEWHIRTIPIPDLTNRRVSIELSNVFERFKSVEWKSLPEQYKEALEGKNLNRLDYDLAVIRSLASASDQDINEEDVKKYLLNMYEILHNSFLVS